MTQEQTPTDIARQALKDLVLHKLPPTPENFRRAYDDIAGQRSEDALQMLVRLLRDAGSAHSRWLGLAVQIEHAAAKGDAAAQEQLIRQLIPAGNVAGNWGDVLRDLLKELETNRPGYTLSKKKDALERVLTNFGGDPAALVPRLQGLVALWKGSGESLPNELVAELEPIRTVPVEHGASGPGLSSAPTDTAIWWREMLIQTLEFGVVSGLAFLPELQDHARQVLEQAKSAHTDKETDKLGEAIKALWYRLELNRDAQTRLHEALLQLMRLLVDNVAELVVDDEWMQGQIQIIQDIMTHPLELDAIYEAESALKELLFKQGKLKHSVIEAREGIKRMAEDFVARLAQMTEHAGQYHARIEGYQAQISSTGDIVELNVVLDGLMRDTHSMQMDALRAHDDIKAIQTKADEAQSKVRELTMEMSQLSEMAQEDYLTGALNRRGMNDAFEREFNRAERAGTPVSVAVLDVDHFKKLNDGLGHEAGDKALMHLVRVTREALRPTDILARYGGEEFVIILPETDVEEGLHVMQRVQRELTKNIFLHNNQKVLITFSAGVAQRQAQEPQEQVIQRADEAMYRAKHAGRNRVFSAE
jgi:diguanylate cyclase